MTRSTSTISDRINNHETRLTAFEIGASNPYHPTKPWWLSQGVMGPLASGVTTVALHVGDVAGWPGRLSKANAGFEMTPTAERLVMQGAVV